MNYKKGHMRQYFSMTLSRLAYIKDYNRLRKELEKIGFYLLGTQDLFSYDEMDGFVASCKEGQVVVFRGSELEKENHYKDWKINFDIKLVDIEIDGIKIKNVARGYGKRIEKYWYKLKTMIWDDYPLITGHSAGGGYATIFSRAVKDAITGRVHCIPHARPRVVDTHHFLPECIYTINSADIVPKVPLYMMDRRHTGTLIYYNRRGKYRKMAKIERIVNFILDSRDVASDHEPREYEKLWFQNWSKIERVI